MPMLSTISSFAGKHFDTTVGQYLHRSQGHATTNVSSHAYIEYVLPWAGYTGAIVMNGHCRWREWMLRRASLHKRKRRPIKGGVFVSIILDGAFNGTWLPVDV
jgi:hypothetical protein